VKSRSYEQLKGTYLGVNDLTDCDPIIRNKDIKENLRNVRGDLLDPEGPAIPCGLVAKSFFNDEYKINGGLVTIQQDNIAWDSDK
jgi:hypothetical protein